MVKFAWCLPYLLELALKDSLVNAMDDIHEVLTFFVLLTQEDKKKLSELGQFLEVLKDVYSFENDQVRPSKASGTRWIARIMRSMTAFIQKFGVYLQHLVNVVAYTSKQAILLKWKGREGK